MTHLTSDELLDAMEGLLGAERQAHLSSCAECQRQLAGLSGVLGEARQVSVPEPSPLFWQHFSQRVSRAIDEAPSTGGWPAWLRWQVLLPLGAVALVLLALTVSIPKRHGGLGVVNIADESVTGATAGGDSWVAFADLVGDVDLDTAAAAGMIVKPDLVEQAVLELTAEEQQELTRLLRAELQRAKS